MKSYKRQPSAFGSVVLVDDALSVKAAAFVASYIEHGNATRAYRDAFDTAAMLPATIKRKAFDVLHSPPVAAEVARLRKVAAEAVAADVGALALRCFELAEASPADLMEVVSHQCPYCRSLTGLHPAWPGVDAYVDACERWQASLNTPKPEPQPDLRGGTAYDPTSQDVNPDCRQCKGKGVTTLHVRPTSEWSDAARQLFDGAVVDNEGKVQRLLFQDRSKYRDQLHKLLGLYVAKTESKSFNVNYNLAAPATAQPPMSADDALAKLRALGILSPDTVVDEQ